MKDHFEASLHLHVEPPKTISNLGSFIKSGMCKRAIYFSSIFSEGSGRGSCNEGGPASCSSAGKFDM